MKDHLTLEISAIQYNVQALISQYSWMPCLKCKNIF